MHLILGSLHGVSPLAPQNTDTIIEITDEALVQLKLLRDEEPEKERLGLRLEVMANPGEEFQYDLSFDQYVQGNAIKKGQSRYSTEQMLEEFEAQKRVCNPSLMARRNKTGFNAPDPIFITGLPRAGSTLLEQIYIMFNLSQNYLNKIIFVPSCHKIHLGTFFVLEH